MIEKTQNIYHHPSIKRLVEVDKHSKQITLHDQRFYQRDKDTFYPSVTYVLSYFPKSKFFENWIKDVGHNIDIILRRASEEGTMVHNAIESYLKGDKLQWISDGGNVNYPTEVWRMIVKFVDFWETVKPKLYATEVHLFSDDLKFAGTADLVCEINDELWLIDVKTSNSIFKSFDLQTAAYAYAWNETHEPKVTRRGILWLKSSKRGYKKDCLQGDGWEIKESNKSLEDDIKMFNLAYELFKIDNEDMIPDTETLPNEVSKPKTLVRKK